MVDRSAQVRRLNPYDPAPHFCDDGVILAPHSVLDRWIRLGEPFTVQGRRCWPDGEPTFAFYRDGLRMARLAVRSVEMPVEVRRCTWCNEPATKGRFCDECFPHRKAILAIVERSGDLDSRGSLPSSRAPTL